LGCVEDCPTGFTSIGNNNISGNLGNPDGYPTQIEANGGAQVKAENNYWGYENGLLECYVVPDTEGPFPPDTRCDLVGHGSSIDAVPFLSAPPDLGF